MIKLRIVMIVQASSQPSAFIKDYFSKAKVRYPVFYCQEISSNSFSVVCISKWKGGDYQIFVKTIQVACIGVYKSGSEIGRRARLL